MKNKSGLMDPAFFIPAILGLAFGSVLLTSVRAEDARSTNRNSIFLVSPLVGAVRDETEVAARPGTPVQTLTDTSAEYGLFLMYANPRLVLNNTLFNADVNDSSVWGDIASLGLYGDPAARTTWYLGGSYLWHEIDGDTADITVSEPLAKVGLLFRVPVWHLSINPYVGYGWQRVETTVSTPGRAIEQTEHTESMIYGVLTQWRWRMFAAYAKYYLEDNLDRNERYNVFRFWATAMCSKHAGILGRIEYSEQVGSTTVSALFGPVFYF